MFVQNQISHLDSHQDVITAEIDNADEMLFVVAYVRENGVDIILDKIKNKPTKLLCSLDMGITQLSSIKKLIENGVEVKVYQSNKGTFHPKIWLFGKNKTNWKMLIGSANLTRAAFIDNVEASVLVDDKNTTSNALIFFNYLWDRENSSTITLVEVDSLQKKVNERQVFKNKSIELKENKNDTNKNKILFEYVKSWIDIPKYDSKGISSLWRGWYIIPDHGLISDSHIKNLQDYLQFINNGITIGKNSEDESYLQLLKKFKENSNFQKKNLKTSMHGLFTRQAKNYLRKFGWCYQPDRNTLCLTDLGKQINQCDDLNCVKNLYSEYFNDYSFNGLIVVSFTKQLLQALEYLTLDEFNYFVMHSYNDDEVGTIINFIKTYRSLSDYVKFKQDFNSYFQKEKSGTAKGVYMNYVKSVKHTMSVISWCNGFYLSGDFVLKLNNAN
jgi:HKD family nuclease